MNFDCLQLIVFSSFVLFFVHLFFIRDQDLACLIIGLFTFFAFCLFCFLKGDVRTKAFPPKRQEVLKWNGWGFQDASFVMDDAGLSCFNSHLDLLEREMEKSFGIITEQHCDTVIGIVSFQGKQYEMGGTVMPSLRAWMEEKRQMDFTHPTPSQVNRMLIDLMMCECVVVIPSHHVMSLTQSSSHSLPLHD